MPERTVTTRAAASSARRTGTDVLIVGAGPTGLTLANLLGGMGVRTLLVERNESTVTEPRAVSIDDESMRAMQAAGLASRVQAITARGYGSIYLAPDGRPFAKVMPQTREYGFDKRNAFEQPALEAILRDGLARFACVEARFGVTLTGFEERGGHVHVDLRQADGTDAVVRAGYVVGADGGRSGIRKMLGVAMDGGTFEEPWLIVDLAETANRNRHTEVFCDPARSCISLPGPDRIRRYEFLLGRDEDRDAVTREPFVRDLLASVGPDRDAELRRVRVYTFHARLARHWRQGRVFLAGDAAHLTPPFAGQGMNSGLRDAHNLAWKLAEALHAQAPEALLDSYQAERKPHAQAMIDLALRMGQVMMPSSPLQGRLVRGGFRALSLYPPARDYFAQMKYKPKPRFVDGLVWVDATRPAKAVTGRMLPQPEVETPGRERHLMDDLLPDAPVALVFADRPEEAMPAVLRHRFAEAGCAVVGLTPEGINPVMADFPIVRDASRFFSAAPYSECLDHVFLLRRDRYVAAVRPKGSAEDLLPCLTAIAPRDRVDAGVDEPAAMAS